MRKTTNNPQLRDMNMKTGKTIKVLSVVAAAFGLPLVVSGQEPTFTAITDSPISESYAFSAAWGDYDGDGLVDLLFVDPFQGVMGQTQIYLFKNQGGGFFDKRVTVTRGRVRGPTTTTMAIWIWCSRITIGKLPAAATNSLSCTVTKATTITG